MAQGFSCAFPSFSLGAGHGEGSWREQNKELTSKVLMTVNCQANDLMCTVPSLCRPPRVCLCYITGETHILFYLRPLPQGTLNVRAVFSADLGVQWQRAVAGRGRMARALTESSGLSFGHWFPSLNGSSTFSCVYQSEWLYQQVARDSPRSTPSSSCGGFAACVSECICKLSGLLITAPITAGLSLFLQIAEECVSHC